LGRRGLNFSQGNLRPLVAPLITYLIGYLQLMLNAYDTYLIVSIDLRRSKVERQNVKRALTNLVINDNTYYFNHGLRI